MQEEAKREAKKLEQHEKVMNYYKDSKVLEYFFATNRGGKSVKPIVAGAALFNEKTQVLDLHFIAFKYRKSYMQRFSADNADFEHAICARQQAIECLQPSLINHEGDVAGA